MGMLGTETALQGYQFPHSCAHLTHYHIPGGGWDHLSLPAASTAQLLLQGAGEGSALWEHREPQHGVTQARIMLPGREHVALTPECHKQGT